MLRSSLDLANPSIDASLKQIYERHHNRDQQQSEGLSQLTREMWQKS